MITIKQVIPEEHWEIADYFAQNLHYNDLSEAYALGIKKDQLHDGYMMGMEKGKTFVAYQDETPVILGGYITETQTVWMVTSKPISEMTPRERTVLGLKLRTVVRKELASLPEGFRLSNVVGRDNHSHIKLIKTMGGKGFNTLLKHEETESIFYPFYFEGGA